MSGPACTAAAAPVIHAMGAIEMALWDIKGKAEGKPVYELLGGARQTSIVPVRLAAAIRQQLRGISRFPVCLGAAGARGWASRR